MTWPNVPTVLHEIPSPDTSNVHVSPSRPRRSQYGASAGAATFFLADATPSVIVATNTRGDPPS
jgi:hypothetical protein